MGAASVEPPGHPLWLLAALACLCAGVALAWHHPLWPLAALAILGLGCVVAMWRAGAWLILVPACLPFLNFSPWTGWLVFDEFDILLLGTMAGAYGRLAWSERSQSVALSSRRSRRQLALMTLLGGMGLLGVWRGFVDAGGFSFDWFAGYADALNSLRVFKSLGFALLFVPLLRQAIAESAALASRRLASGVVLGLGGVTLAILWERAAYPGIMDFSAPYRTVALFWEMHVGGAAIDAYLVLTAPFVAWAVLSARRPLHWAAAAAVALLMGYACLTSFSRGVYLAVALPLLLLAQLLQAQKSGPTVGTLWQRHRPVGWRGNANVMLVLALLAELAVVLVGGSFMTQRLASADRDWGGRLAHWQQGLALLHGPADWWLGKGLGRFPENYASHAAQGEFSGTVRWHEAQAPDAGVKAFVTVQGPATQPKLGGLFRLSQRVGPLAPGPHNVSLAIRVQKETDVKLALCEKHLLYDGDCQAASIHVSPSEDLWQPLVLRLEGPPLGAGPWYAPRFGVFSLSVANAGGAADFSRVTLIGSHGESLLENDRFSAGLAHWFPSARSYFLPWHIDNLFLELWIERGLTGLLLFAGLVACALWRLLAGRARSQLLSPYLAASLCAALLLGLVSSFMDVPRVAFLFYLFALFALES